MMGPPLRNSKKATQPLVKDCPEESCDEVSDLSSPLRILREEKGISQQGLALKLGLAKTHIARLESRAISNWSIADLDRICEGLGYQLEELIQRFYTKIKKTMERSRLNAPAYVIHYNDGVQICALVRSGKPYFVGTLRIQPHKEWPKESVITRKEIFIHILQGNLLLKISGKEHLFKEYENLALSMPFSYEIYNPHQFKELVAIIYIAACSLESPNGSKIAG